MAEQIERITEAEDAQSSAFVLSQEDIDIINGVTTKEEIEKEKKAKAKKAKKKEAKAKAGLEIF